MAFQTFGWSPDKGARQKIAPNVKRTKFGDGYELRVPVGVNTKPKNWSVTFTRPAATAEAILDFLSARAGVEPFTWVDPMGKTGTYVCREWESGQMTEGFGVYQISGTFEQVFEF